jgi:hypothetical protein
MRSLGVTVDERSPSIMRANRFSRGYLEAKRRRMNHSLPDLQLADLQLADLQAAEQPPTEPGDDGEEQAPASRPRPTAEGAVTSRRAP